MYRYCVYYFLISIGYMFIEGHIIHKFNFFFQTSEYCENVTSLDLSHNTVDDLTGIGGLANLKVYFLDFYLFIYFGFK